MMVYACKSYGFFQFQQLNCFAKKPTTFQAFFFFPEVEETYSNLILDGRHKALKDILSLILGLISISADILYKSFDTIQPFLLANSTLGTAV